MDWSVVIFTNESSSIFLLGMELHISDRGNVSQLCNDYIVPTVIFGGGGIMVWGAMSSDRGTGDFGKS